jgi:hypothetical protein
MLCRSTSGRTRDIRGISGLYKRLQTGCTGVGLYCGHNSRSYFQPIRAPSLGTNALAETGACAEECTRSPLRCCANWRLGLTASARPLRCSFIKAERLAIRSDVSRKWDRRSLPMASRRSPASPLTGSMAFPTLHGMALGTVRRRSQSAVASPGRRTFPVHNSSQQLLRGCQ